MNNTANNILTETILRHLEAIGEPPAVVRCTSSLAGRLWKEVPALAAQSVIPSVDFHFMGVRCRADLPGDAFAALAIHQP